MTTVLLLNLFVTGLIGAVLIRDYKSATSNATVTADNLSRVLEQNLARFVDKIDLTLQEVIEEIDRQERAGGLDRPALNAFLARHDARLPEALGLRVVNALGQIDYAVSNVTTANANIADREHFTRHRDNPSLGLFISKPVVGRANPKPMIILARRRLAPAGTFAGIVHVAVGLDTLSTIFSRVDLGPKGTVALWNDTPVLLARYGGQTPAPLDGTITPSAILRDLIATGQCPTTYHTASGIDGIERTFSLRKIATWPLHLVVGIADDDALANWRRELVALTALGGVFLLASLAAAMIIQRNLTALSHARTEAEAARRRSDSILLSADEGICGTDRDGNITFINPAARRMLGWDQDEGIGLNLHSQSHHHHADGSDFFACDCPAAQTLQDGQPRHVTDDVYWRKDGSSFPVEFTTAAILHQGAIIGAVNIFRDVTERQRAAEAMQATLTELARSNEESKQFAYVASHDLRQPLRMISSYLGLIERRLGANATDEMKEFLGFAIGGAKRMDRLIRDLLDYSRTGSSGAKPLVALPLGGAVADAMVNLEVAIIDADAEIVVADDLPIISGDQSELTRLFQNLIGNAVKYRVPDRVAAIHIGAKRDGDHWLVWVKDNGLGIAAADYDRAFRIFQRLLPNDSHEGTGIGLAVCKKIVEHHGGTIWIESTLSVGSTFFFTLPMA